MTTNTAPPTTTDPRPGFASAAALAADVVAAVRPDQLARPTPCTEFDVRALLGHVLSVFRRVAAVGRGEPFTTVPHVTTDVPDDGWVQAVAVAVREAEDVWTDPAVLARELRLPFGTLPGAAALATYTGEVSTHTWDLATATGQRPAWDDEVLARALPAIHAKLPADGRGPGIPFGPVVPVAEDAPLIDRLVAWQGRDPSWTPAA
jgi:uncharacterized protein (TIGR03086 family)